MKDFHLHLVSDSTGGTINSVMKASLAQFDDAKPHEHLWHLVRSDRDLKRVIEGIYKNPGPVFLRLWMMRWPSNLPRPVKAWACLSCQFYSP